MALENLTPVTRKESILNGEDIAPVTREEYFWKQAANSGSSGGMTPITLSETFNTGLNSLVQAAITEIVTNQVNSSSKDSSSILTTEDKEAIQSACEAWEDRQVMVNMMDTYFTPIIMNSSENGYAIQTVLPWYDIFVGSTEYMFRISVLVNDRGYTLVLVEKTLTRSGQT